MGRKKGTNKAIERERMRKAEGGGVNLWMDLLKKCEVAVFRREAFNLCIHTQFWFLLLLQFLHISIHIFPLSNFPLLLPSLWKQAIIFYIFRNFPLCYFFFNSDILILLFFLDNFRPFILSFILTNHTLISVSVYHFFFFYLLFILVKSACFLFPRHPSLSSSLFPLPFLRSFFISFSP